MKARRSALSIAVTLTAVLFFLGWSVLLLMPIFDGPWSRRDILQQARATTDVLALEAAIHQYHRTFEHWPNPGTNHVEIVRNLRGDNDARRVFLEVPRSALRHGSYTDPWGIPYWIRMDWEGRGETRLPTGSIPQSVLVWSSGPDRINDYGEGDDIRNW